MVESSDARERDNSPNRRRLNGSTEGCVAGERHVRSVGVVIASVLTDQMPFAQYDHVIEQLSAQGPDEPLDVPVLPQRPRCDS
jgi:hypothetical protein